MLKHHPKLKKLCTNKYGRTDGRKMKSKAFLEEFLKVIRSSEVDEQIIKSHLEHPEYFKRH